MIGKLISLKLVSIKEESFCYAIVLGDENGGMDSGDLQIVGSYMKKYNR